MREGIEEQIGRLFGIEVHRIHAERSQARKSAAKGVPSPMVRVPKTMLTDLRVFGMVADHPLSLTDAFIGDKTPIDVMLEKQIQALLLPEVSIEYHYPQQKLLGWGHAAQNTFEISVRPFTREEERVRLTTPQEEEKLLAMVEGPYLNMPGVRVSRAKNSVHVGDQVRKSTVLVVECDKSPEARRARSILVKAMQDKSGTVS